MVDEKKKLLPPDQAIEVILQDKRLKKIEYHEGIWQARFEMDEKFKIANDSPYMPTFWLDYPVDGLANASIFLGVIRMICSNGVKAISRGFRTEIEVNDNYGTHLSKLLSSYSNDIRINSLRHRLEGAHRTKASVYELQQVCSLLTSNVNDKTKLRALLTRLEELAGDPCFIYQVTSLKNIGPKKAKLLPVECSVNELFIFCSELITHHSSLITSADAFNSLLGNMLSQEFDLEDMYPIRKSAPAFTLNKMEALCV